MSRHRALLLFAALVFGPGAARAASPDEVLCTMMSQSAEMTNAAGPVAVDAMTTQESVTVDCGNRTVLTRFTREDASTDQPDGWRDAWQANLDAAYCGDAAMRGIIGSGWTFAETTRFSDGVDIEIKARCE